MIALDGYSGIDSSMKPRRNWEAAFTKPQYHIIIVYIQHIVGELHTTMLQFKGVCSRQTVTLTLNE
jgi:hypothetical protein